jgi:hypothetical protein
MRRVLPAIVMCSALFVGCAHTVVMSNDIRPSNSYTAKLRGNYQVHIPAEFENYQVRVSPSSYAGSAHSYTFMVGPSAKSAVVNALTSAVDALVQTPVQPSSATMTDGMVKGYFVPQFSNCAIDVYFADGFLTTNAKATANIAVTVKYFDASEQNKFTYTATGSGFSTRGADAFSAEKGFSEAVEMALRQVSDAIAQAVYSSPDLRSSILVPDSTRR